MAAELENLGHSVEVRPCGSLRIVADNVDGVIVAGSVRYGFYAPALKAFVKRNAERLNEIPTCFVGVSLSSDKPERSEPMTNVYSRKFLESTPWKPTLSRLFTGEINFNLYRGFDSFMLGKILEVSGKPHGPGVQVDYTDWDGVRTYAHEFGALLEA